MPVSAEAVLLTGVYGSGKSTVVEEMAGVLEERSTQVALDVLGRLGWE